MPERLFRVIVCWRRPALFQKCKEILLLRTFQIRTQGLGRFKVECFFADNVKAVDKICFDTGC
jgi:hypothetical protein